jgi:hypothetical protein
VTQRYLDVVSDSLIPEVGYSGCIYYWYSVVLLRMSESDTNSCLECYGRLVDSSL